MIEQQREALTQRETYIYFSRYINGLSFEMIAKKLAVSKAAVETAFTRAVNKLTVR